MAIIFKIACRIVINNLTTLYTHTPYHTSALSGADWVQELLTGHPRRIKTKLGVSCSTFALLLKSLQALDVKPSHHVSVEVQLAIFLYTVVTGLPCTHVGSVFSTQQP